MKAETERIQTNVSSWQMRHFTSNQTAPIIRKNKLRCFLIRFHRRVLLHHPNRHDSDIRTKGKALSSFGEPASTNDSRGRPNMYIIDRSTTKTCTKKFYRTALPSPSFFADSVCFSCKYQIEYARPRRGEPDAKYSRIVSPEDKADVRWSMFCVDDTRLQVRLNICIK